jgi:hypothetical protein
MLRAFEQRRRQHDSSVYILEGLLAGDAAIQLRDIKNEIAKLRRSELAGRSLIEALLHFLENFEDGEGNKYFTKVQFNAAGNLRNPFIAHPVCFELVESNPVVVQIDATYKLNQFDVPLLHAVGVTRREKNYNICFGFMAGEERKSLRLAYTGDEGVV